MVKVLFDNNMPPHLAASLDALVRPDGHEAHALRDKFPTTISDEDYFSELSKEKDWIVISKDVKNAKRAPEKRAILSSGVLAFYLAPTVQKLRVNEQAATILWQWDKLVEQRKNNSNGMFLLPIGKRSKFTAI
jgi:hypothetical protein